MEYTQTKLLLYNAFKTFPALCYLVWDHTASLYTLYVVLKQPSIYIVENHLGLTKYFE